MQVLLIIGQCLQSADIHAQRTFTISHNNKVRVMHHVVSSSLLMHKHMHHRQSKERMRVKSVPLQSRVKIFGEAVQ